MYSTAFWIILANTTVSAEKTTTVARTLAGCGPKSISLPESCFEYEGTRLDGSTSSRS